ncbi:MAG: hypothetical protein MHM6MM_002306 [Cercozoa sp. M6MM]
MLQSNWSNPEIPSCFSTLTQNKCLEIRSRGLNARFRMVFPRAGKTARDAVVRGSIKINADYIVVATHHRKQKNTNATVIGSTVDASVREAPASALVVKPCSEPVPVQGCKFLVALDPTPGADAAFRRALAMAREGDSVTVLHVVHPVDIDGQEVAQRLRQKVEQIQMPHLDVSFRLVESHHIAETIMKCAKEIEAHVIVVGIEAEVSTGLHLGSVSDAIVRKSDCMVLASQPAEMMGQSEEQLFKRRSCSTLQSKTLYFRLWPFGVAFTLCIVSFPG